MAEAARLQVVVGADTQPLTRGLHAADAQVKSFGKSFTATNQQAASSLSGLGRGISAVAGSFGGATRGAQQLGAAMGGVTRQAQSLNQTLTQGLLTGLGFAAANMAMAKFSQGVGAAKAAVIDFNAQVEQLQVSFEVMLGSSQKATAFLDQLKTFARETPFEFPDLIKGTQRLMAMGFAAEQTIPLMRGIGNAAAQGATGAAGIDRISLAIGQMRAKTKVSAEEMRQLTEASIPAWELLAKEIGKTEAETMKMAENGEIAAATMVRAFMKMYGEGGKLGDLMDKQSKTFVGAMSNIKDGLTQALAQGFVPFFNALRDGANAIATALNSETFRTWVTAFSVGIAAATEKLKTFLSGLAPVGVALKEAFALFSTGDVSGGMARLGQGLQEALDSIWTRIQAFTAGMYGAGSSLMGAYAQGITTGAVNFVAAAINGVATLIASFLIGRSPPPEGPLSTIDQGGAALMETYVSGMLGGLGDLSSVALAVSDALGNVTGSLTQGEATAALHAAVGNMDALEASATRVDGVIRTLDRDIRDNANAIRDVKLASDDIKTAYDAAITPLEEQLAALKNQGAEQGKLIDLSGKQLDLNDRVMAIDDRRVGILQKQTDLVQKQTDIQDKLTMGALAQRRVDALGDPSARARAQARLDEATAAKEVLGLSKEGQDIERRRADILETLGEKTKKGEKGPDRAALATELEMLDADQRILEAKRAAADLVNRPAFDAANAEVLQAEAAQKVKDAEKERQGLLRDAETTQKELARLPGEQLRLQLDVTKAVHDQGVISREILALPLEAKVAALKAEQAGILAPLEAQRTALERQGELLGHTKSQWSDIKGQITDVTAALKAQEAAAKEATAKDKAGAGRDTDFGINAQAITDSARVRAEEAGANLAAGLAVGFQRWADEHFGALAGAKLGAVLGAVAFGPIGAAVGLALGGAIGAGVDAQVPDLQTRVTTGMEQIKTQGLIPAVQSWWPAMQPVIVQLGTDLLTWLAAQVEPIKAQLLAWGQEFMLWVGPAAELLLAEARALGTRLTDWIAEQAPNLASNLEVWGGTFYEWVSPAARQMMTNLGELWLELWQWIADRAPNIGEQLGLWAVEFGTWAVTKALPELIRGVGELIIWINTEGIRAMQEAGVNLGKGFVAGLAKGLVNAGGTDAQLQVQGPWGDKARAYATAAGMSPAQAETFARQMQHESANFNEDVIYGRRFGGSGEVGIAQFMPATAAGRGLTHPENPELALAEAAKMMVEYLNKYGQDMSKALTAYNAGPGRVGNPPESTVGYIQKIMGGGPVPAAGAGGYVSPIPGYSQRAQLHHGSFAGASDLFAPAGTPVQSMGAGRVTQAGYNALGGNMVMVEGEDGRSYYYAHLKDIPLVQAGQRVEPGTPLGTVGNTGNAINTPSHLHMGIGYGISEGKGPEGGAGINYDAVGQLNAIMHGSGGLAGAGPVLQELQANLAGVGETLQATVDPQVQAFADLIGQKVPPAGVAAGTAIQQMAAASAPLFNEFATGQTDVEGLSQGLLNLASQTGVATAPLDDFLYGTATSGEAMQALMSAMAATDPAFAAIATNMTELGTEGNVANLMLQGLAHATGAAAPAMQQMSGAVAPLVTQAAAGALSTDELNRSLVGMAAGAGLTTAPLRELTDGVITSDQALAQVIDSSAEIGPEFATLAQEMHDAGTVTQPMAEQFLNLVAAYGKAPAAMATAGEATEAAGVTPFEQILIGAQTNLNQIGPLMTSSLTQVTDALSSAVDPAREGGAQIGQAIVEGITSAVADAAGDIAKAAADVVKKAIAAAKKAASSGSKGGGDDDDDDDKKSNAESMLGATFMAQGGVITEKILGVGASGRRYVIGEAGPEVVLPLDEAGEIWEFAKGSKKKKKKKKGSDPAPEKNPYPYPDLLSEAEHTQQRFAVMTRLTHEETVETMARLMGAINDYVANASRARTVDREISALKVYQAQEQQKMIPLAQAVAATQLEIATIQKGSLADQHQVVSLTTEKLRLDLAMVQVNEQLRREFADIKIIQRDTLRLSVMEAKVAQEQLAPRRALLTLDRQIADLSRETAAHQKAAIAADTQRTAVSLEELQLQHQIEAAEKAGFAGTVEQQVAAQYELNLQRERLKTLEEQGELLDYNAQLLAYQETLATAGTRTLLVDMTEERRLTQLALDDQAQAITDQLAPLTAETRLLEAQRALREAELTGPIADKSEALQNQLQIISLTNQISSEAAQHTLVDQSAVLAAQQAIVQAHTNQLELMQGELSVYQAQLAVAQQLSGHLQASGMYTYPQAKAAGGPVSGGTPYMVGEQGPELFVPSSDGFIVANSGTRSASAGGSSGGGFTWTGDLIVQGSVLTERDLVTKVRDGLVLLQNRNVTSGIR